MKPQPTDRQPQSDYYDYGLHHDHENFDTDWLVISHICRRGKIRHDANPLS